MDYKAGQPSFPQSTYQILGAEKALFKALKQKGIVVEQKYPFNQIAHQSKIKKVFAKKLLEATQLKQQAAAIGQMENLTLNEVPSEDPQQHMQTTHDPNNDIQTELQDE